MINENGKKVKEESGDSVLLKTSSVTVQLILN